MSDVKVPQSIINEVEAKCWSYRCKAKRAIQLAEERLRKRLYLNNGVDFSRATMIVVEDK